MLDESLPQVAAIAKAMTIQCKAWIV